MGPAKRDENGIVSQSPEYGDNWYTLSDSKVITLCVISLLAAILVLVSFQDQIQVLIFAQLLGTLFMLLAWKIYHYRWIYAAIRTLPRDLRGLVRYGKVFLHKIQASQQNLTVGKAFAKNVKKHPQKVCLYFEDEVWTFEDVDKASNRIANYFCKTFKKGDSVALFMESRSEYVLLWLGLSKIGVVTALINYSIRLDSLKHCIEVANSKAIIYGHELSNAVQEMLNNSPSIAKLPLYCSGHGKETILPNAIDLDEGLKSSSSKAPILASSVNYSDKALYIYTSGTTGLPKAAVIKHSRMLLFSSGSGIMAGISRSDIIYDPLPLYHTAGALVGVGQAIIRGCTVVIKRKFSVKSFWADCQRYNCSGAQYIGEICRYLLSQPMSPSDTNHSLKFMYGNGMRPQIWAEFTKRFNIKNIVEIYGATEGNCNLFNIDNREGAVGFVSIIIPSLYPVALIRVDERTGEPLRDPKTGLVVKCVANESGELVGRIDINDPTREFEGYADSTSTNKKILQDVFRKGDSAFRTGDLLMMDEFGYLYFKDRTGDTFRWKGENCSNFEIEAVISSICNLNDVAVYGVEIPGAEGKAGMAAIVDPDESLDLDALAAGIIKALPSYARPLFLRILKEMDMTGTFKIKKIDLQMDGFDHTKIEDKIYLFSNGKYTPLTNELYFKIRNAEIRL